MATKSAQLETVPSSPPSATKMAQNQKTPIDSSSHALAKKKKQASKSTWRKEPLDCPLFLRKAYHMIDTCDPAVAGWTEDGDMFVVKDPEIFASTIIPQFFKHNNFASFVRQLNFYGFRKVKCDPIKLDTPVDEAESKYWRFRHRNFQKDRLDLLNSMRRKDPNAPAPEQGDDVTELKTEVTTLRTCIDTMSKDIDKLTSFMENMMMKDKEEENDKREECPTTPENDDLKEDVKRTIAGIKKRKVVNLLPNLATASDSDFVMEDVPSGVSVDQVASSSAVKIEPVSTSGRGVSFTSITSSDQEFVNELFTDLGIDDSEDDAKPIPPLDPLDAQITSDVGNDAVDPRLMRKLHDALALLPKDLQELFVDRLVVAITNPDACQSQLDAIMALSAAASDSTSAASNQKREDSLVALPLAAAKLSAILAQYGHGHKGLPVVPVHA